VTLDHYPAQGSKAKGTRPTPYYSKKELLSLTYSTTTKVVNVKSSLKEKKEKGRVYHLRIDLLSLL
jgi:hypothetical protein